jgi:hypothetical protein
MSARDCRHCGGSGYDPDEQVPGPLGKLAPEDCCPVCLGTGGPPLPGWREDGYGSPRLTPSAAELRASWGFVTEEPAGFRKSLAAVALRIARRVPPAASLFIAFHARQACLVVYGHSDPRLLTEEQWDELADVAIIRANVQLVRFGVTPTAYGFPPVRP